jgi:hypothetical protein
MLFSFWFPLKHCEVMYENVRTADKDSETQPCREKWQAQAQKGLGRVQAGGKRL